MKKTEINQILEELKVEKPDVYELLLERYGISGSTDIFKLSDQDKQQYKEGSQAIASILDSRRTKTIITRTLGKIKKKRPDIYELLLEKYGMSGSTDIFKLSDQDEQQCMEDSKAITRTLDSIETKIIVTQILGELKVEKPEDYESLLEVYGVSELTGSFKLSDQDMQQIINQTPDYAKTKNRK